MYKCTVSYLGFTLAMTRHHNHVSSYKELIERVCLQFRGSVYHDGQQGSMQGMVLEK